MTKDITRRTSVHGLLLSTLFFIALVSVVLQRYVNGLGYSDELIAVILMTYGILNGYLFKKTEFIIFVIVMAFYVIYSLILDINVPQGIYRDALQFMKPFFSFYALSFVSISLTDKWRKKFRKASIVLGIILVVSSMITVSQFEAGEENATIYMNGILAAIAYFIFSEKKQKDWYIALLFLTPGLFSGKAKFLSIFVLFIGLAFFVRKKLAFNMKLIVSGVVGITAIVYLTWEKFYGYFIAGEDTVRNALYVNGIDIMRRFFPFGSGFATWGTEATKPRNYYSPLYYDYGINELWGGSGTMGDAFLADTFYPCLAQFGVVGVILFIWFFIRRYQSIKKLNVNSYKIGLFIIGVVLVQNVADAGTMLGPMSVPVFMALGIASNPKSNLMDEVNPGKK